MKVKELVKMFADHCQDDADILVQLIDTESMPIDDLCYIVKTNVVVLKVADMKNARPLKK